MNIIEILSLFGIMIVLAALPSASTALVVTRSATVGLANGVAVSIGIILGDLVFILFVIFGLSIVAETMGGLFMVIKYLGAIYLFWLGYTLLRTKDIDSTTVSNKNEKRSLITSFFAGFILTLGDIKAIFFYVSILPAFINLSDFQLTDVLILISVMIVSLGSVKIMYAFMAIKVVSFSKNYKCANAARKTAGGLMIGTSCYLIIKS